MLQDISSASRFSNIVGSSIGYPFLIHPKGLPPGLLVLLPEEAA
jgi:hypothetical protein